MGVVSASPGTSISISWSGGSGTIAETGWEMSGVATVSLVDGSVATNYANSSSGSTGSYSNTNANDVIIACCGNLGSLPTSTGSGWTALTGVSGASDSLACAYKIVSSAAAQSETWTTTGNPWSSLIIGLKAAATGAIAAAVAGSASVSGTLKGAGAIVSSPAGLASVTATAQGKPH